MIDISGSANADIANNIETSEQIMNENNSSLKFIDTLSDRVISERASHLSLKSKSKRI